MPESSLKTTASCVNIDTHDFLTTWQHNTKVCFVSGTSIEIRMICSAKPISNKRSACNVLSIRWVPPSWFRGVQGVDARLITSSKTINSTTRRLKSGISCRWCARRPGVAMIMAGLLVKASNCPYQFTSLREGQAYRRRYRRNEYLLFHAIATHNKRAPKVCEMSHLPCKLECLDSKFSRGRQHDGTCPIHGRVRPKFFNQRDEEGGSLARACHDA